MAAKSVCVTPPLKKCFVILSLSSLIRPLQTVTSRLKRSRWICTSPEFSVCCHSSDSDAEEPSAQPPQQVASAVVNSSPKVPRVELPNAVQPAQPSRPECFDVTLQRKDTEGFGFVILTSKSKPPPGGQSLMCEVFCLHPFIK